METTTKWIAGSLTIAFLIFVFSPGPQHLIANPTAWEFREQLVFLTGLSAMSLMVLSMIISVRWPWINRRLKGLDKAYVVHKWTGIVSTILVVFHWLAEKLPGWLVEWGLIADPGELTDSSGFSDLEIDLFQSGVFLAEWMFYVLILLVMIALFNRIPYHLFRKSHKLFPAIFLVAAYHGATAQLKEHWLDTPAGYILSAMLAVGVVAALIGLFQQIGKSRKVTAVIKQIEQHESGILELQLDIIQKPDARNPFNHRPGQYAFLKFTHNPEPHPFTIASGGMEPGRLNFAIKSLGGFTAGLPNKLLIGQSVELEGPYGEFNFEDESERQVWVAGGIGITPFLAMLEYLVAHGGADKPIYFWYSTRSDKDSMFAGSLEVLCRQSGVNFYHLNSIQKEYLTIDKIKNKVGSLNDVSIWFCGPEVFAQCLLKDLDADGFGRQRFHSDSFNMR